MNRMVAAIVSAMVNDPQFSKAIKEKIGTSVDTKDLESQLAALQAQLRQTMGIKTRLERQMDSWILTIRTLTEKFWIYSGGMMNSMVE